MKIEHLAIWVHNLETMRAYYEKYFGASAGDKYTNPTKNFQSYFLSFSDGCRLELMQKPEIPANMNNVYAQHTGLIHFAISTGSKEAVEQLTATLKADGFEILDGPRTTGDGYYESVTIDPEGNRIEITI